jgi:hypothetical protein
MSTRAPLLPTISHALSQSLYYSAKSPTFTAKLKEILSHASQNGEPCKYGDSPSSEVVPATPKSRFEAMSTSIWNLMQYQLRRSDRAQRLKPLIYRPDRITRDADNDLKLFDESFPEHLNDDFMLDDERKGEREEEVWHDDDDELFESVEEKDWYERDDLLLFQEFSEQSRFDGNDLLRKEAGVVSEEEEAMSNCLTNTYVGQERQDNGYDLLFEENAVAPNCVKGDLFLEISPAIPYTRNTNHVEENEVPHAETLMF